MTTTLDREIEFELSLSDDDFRKLYLEKNQRWWDEHFERHNGVVHCADCDSDIKDSGDIRPYAGKNYDDTCFRKHAYEEATSVRGFNTPDNCLATEWCLKVSRVMDGVTLIGE